MNANVSFTKKKATRTNARATFPNMSIFRLFFASAIIPPKKLKNTCGSKNARTKTETAKLE